MKHDDPFSKFMLYSLGCHIAVGLILTVKMIFFPSDALEYERSVRVDVVDLPDKIKPQVPIAEKEEPPPAKEKKKPEPPKPKPQKPKPAKKAPKKKQNSALARLKAMQKIKEQQKKQETQKVEYKGNELSKGNSLTGLQKLKYDSYSGQLDNHIKNFWNLPEWLANDTLKASVLLLINKDGSVRMKSFLLKSGNPQYDDHVMGTINKAAPFPAPPKDMARFFASKGIEIRFP